MLQQSAEAPVLVARDGAVATVTLNRPAKLNPLEGTLLTALGAALDEVEADPAVAVVVLRGAGKAFVAGGDLEVLHSDGPDAWHLVARFQDAIRQISSMGKPVLASLHGAVAGGGFSLALACDLAIAGDDMRMIYAYSKIAATCDGGLSYRLPRMVGTRKALELALIGDAVDAAEALRLGLVNWVVPAAALEAETARIARRLAKLPPDVCRQTKALFRQSWARDLDEQLKAEVESFRTICALPTFRQAIASFLAKA